MQHFVVKNWRQCISALGRGYAACGINCRFKPFFHFSGNFFWASCRHVNSKAMGPLGPPSDRFPKTFDYMRPPHRGYAEAWLLDTNASLPLPKVWHCYDDDTDHYLNSFNMSRLEGLDCSKEYPMH
jgi:hypothetical protein